MIRIALIAISFLAVTITLIVMQPSAPRLEAQAEPEPTTPVTRADTDFETLADIAAAAQGLADELETAALATDGLPDLPAADTALETPPTQAAASGVPPQGDLELMIVTALNQGQSEAYIDALVNDAAQKGKVEVPGALVTSDGRVDTATLLKVLSPSPDALRAGGHIYAVQPGDSLASISYRFYGTTDRHADIFDANQDTIGSTGQITVGQELVIPAR